MSTPAPAPAPHPLNEALGHTASDKRLEVLRRVGHTGSISQAARDAGISYKAAWQAIETLSNLSGLPLVDRSVGGTGGGGARITPHGTRLLALSDALAQARAGVLARFDREGLEPLPLSTGLGLRTSMRNQLPCAVVGVQAQEHGTLVAVALQTAAGDRLWSTITRDSADLLGLVPGLQVLALCKATAVAVQPGAGDGVGGADVQPDALGAGALCRLHGQVAQSTGEAGGQEVALALAGGGVWTGFAALGTNLHVGDAACAVFAPSAVVIGLSE